MEENREARTNLYLPPEEHANSSEINHFANTTIPRNQENDININSLMNEQYGDERRNTEPDQPGTADNL